MKNEPEMKLNILFQLENNYPVLSLYNAQHLFDNLNVCYLQRKKTELKRVSLPPASLIYTDFQCNLIEILFSCFF